MPQRREGVRRGIRAGLLVLGLFSSATGAVAKTGPPPPVKPLAVRLADSVLSRWPIPAAIASQGFEYTTGIVLYGIAEVYRHTRDPRYLAYIRTWVDAYLRDDGSVDLGDDAGGHNLDRIQPGNLVLFLYEETGDAKYARAARWLRARLDTFPRNSAGGFWHKKKYPDQMWLDGIYMAEPFLVRYGRMFAEPGFCFDTAVAQTLLVGEKTRAGGGLFRHAWDANRNAAWADPATGISPEAWGRAMGWYVMALVDILAELPQEHPGHARLCALLREAAGGIRRTQDPKTGLWYQVMDKGDQPGNWLETSASAMFVYALRRGVDAGLLGPADSEAARKGWSGLASRISEDAEGRPVVEDTSEGTSVQKDLAGYLGRKRLTNAPHGLCGMLLAASAMEWPRARQAADRARLAAPEPPLGNSDGDGMPDAWEIAHGLNPQNPADGAALGAGGISNLETYLNERARVSTTPTTGKIRCALVRPVVKLEAFRSVRHGVSRYSSGCVIPAIGVPRGPVLPVCGLACDGVPFSHDG